ncbi:MAG: isocitrate lyase/phosphoenolpyruvate mutase family protein [Planctomycetes bacterium]|nr:isocitrate lyase/phosphoenolpyruvate mutase family protein [Planctomycetota bacterium]
MAAPAPAVLRPAPDGAATAPGGAALRRAAATETLGIVGAPFALAAKLVEPAGFDAVYLSGAAFSAGTLGVPDIGLFTRDQLVEQTRILARAVSIPLVVDADTGFGGPRDVEETVRLLEAAGAAAIQLEDQRGADKRCGHLAGKQVIDVPEMADKLAAAAAGRRDPGTVIIGRCDSRSVHGLDDCLARLHAYRAAGADWLFPEALQSRDEFGRVGSEFAGSIPLLANMTEFGTSPLISIPDLAALGFAAVLYPVTLMRLAMKAMEAGLALIAEEGTQENLLDLMESRQELYELLDYDPKHPERHRFARSQNPEEPT